MKRVAAKRQRTRNEMQSNRQMATLFTILFMCIGVVLSGTIDCGTGCSDGSFLCVSESDCYHDCTNGRNCQRSTFVCPSGNNKRTVDATGGGNVAGSTFNASLSTGDFSLHVLRTFQICQISFGNPAPLFGLPWCVRDFATHRFVDGETAELASASLTQDVESLYFVHLRDQWLARLLALDRPCVSFHLATPVF